MPTARFIILFDLTRVDTDVTIPPPDAKKGFVDVPMWEHWHAVSEAFTGKTVTTTNGNPSPAELHRLASDMLWDMGDWQLDLADNHEPGKSIWNKKTQTWDIPTGNVPALTWKLKYMAKDQSKHSLESRVISAQDVNGLPLSFRVTLRVQVQIEQEPA